MAATKEQIKNQFETFIENIGGKVADPSKLWQENKGKYSIDYIAAYGGYVIVKQSEVSSGESTPFGRERMKANDFFNALHFANRVFAEIESQKRKRKEKRAGK